MSDIGPLPGLGVFLVIFVIYILISITGIILLAIGYIKQKKGIKVAGLIISGICLTIAVTMACII